MFYKTFALFISSERVKQQNLGINESLKAQGKENCTKLVQGSSTLKIRVTLLLTQVNQGVPEAESVMPSYLLGTIALR